MSERFASQVHGPSRKLTLLTQHLAEDHPDVDFRVLTEDPTTRDTRVLCAEVEIPRLFRPLSKLYRGWRYWRQAKQLRSTWPFDVIVFNDAPQAWAAVGGGGSDLLCVAMLNDDNHLDRTRRKSEHWRRFVIRRLYHSVERFVCRRADTVIACSDYLKGRVLQSYLPDVGVAKGGKVETLYPALASAPAETSQQTKARSSLPNLVFVKSDPLRGGLLDLLATLGEESLRSKFGVITLAGFDADQYSSYIPWELLRDPQFKLEGYLSRERLNELLLASDIGVVPSRHEAYGITAQEYAAAGCYVVASDAGGLPEATREIDALTFAAGDKLGLGQALGEAADLFVATGPGPRFVPSYDAAAMTRVFVEVINDMLT